MSLWLGIFLCYPHPHVLWVDRRTQECFSVGGDGVALLHLLCPHMSVAVNFA